MIEINLLIDDETITYTAPSKREELRLKHFAGFLMILDQYREEIKKSDEDEELNDRGKQIKLGLATTRFQSKLVSLMLDVDYKKLEDQIGIMELEQLSKEFDWMLDISYDAPSDESLQDLPEELSIELDGEVMKLKTDLDGMSIGAFGSIEELMSQLATDYFKQFHFILAILILAEQNVYDLQQTQILGKRIWEQVYLSDVYTLLFFLGIGKKKYSLHTKVCSLLETHKEGREWMTKILEMGITDKKEDSVPSGDSTK